MNRNRPIAVLAALEVEAATLASNLPRSDATSPNLAIWEGALESEPVVLAITGVGKVAAAMAAQFICDAHRPQALISVGLAGGVGEPGERGRLIVATGAVHRDFDARPLTNRKGMLPGLGVTTLHADHVVTERLRIAALKVVERAQIVVSGVVLTGDQIVASSEMRDRLLQEFPDGACFDMETAAVAQVAHQNQVPWGALRITSDSADENFSLHEVLGFGAHSAAELFDRVITSYLRL
ncbi:MAG TPA: 5'-methylthioadenosine/S-adenosylhomocysteine nucleosidase [Candidatus Dormibacteraeota bacterium]|nr:5'-methylthioadenosine/S-adenosylhomocysteine nucleosidase [Candidatus Dormibacteraeota bacterium]